MPAMKRQIKILFALLFILSTLTSSLHEMLPEHDESSCEVCTLVQYDSGLVPEEYIAPSEICLCCETILFFETQIVSAPLVATNPRAPPLFS